MLIVFFLPVMKKLLLPILLILQVFTATAQEDGNISYYYKGEKIYLPVSYDRVLIEVRQGRPVTQVKKSIARLIGVTEDSMEVGGLSNQVMVKLSRNTSDSKAKTSLSKLDALPEVLFSRPVFKSASGKYSSYGRQFIVNLRTGISFSEVQKLMDATGSALVRKYPFQDDIYILSAGIKSGYDGLLMANQFFESGLFDYAEPEMYVYDAIDAVPNDPLYNYQWAHNNTGSTVQFSGTPGVDMKIQQAWNFTMGSSAVKIGLLDDGVDLTHPDLQDNLLQGFNGATLTSNPGDGGPLTSSNAHGTNCAGIIAAVANNGIGVAGVAPNCKIIPAVIFNGSTSLGTVAQAACFDYVRLQGADIISNSWGGGSPSSIIDDAINRAVTLGRNGKGCIVFASSGNNNTAVHFPAAYPQVIAVGGISMCNQRKSPTSCDGETNWGANYGPGLAVVAPATRITTTDLQGAFGYNRTAGVSGNYYTRFTGTSSSCPNAAGVMALMLSYNPQLTAADAKRYLFLSCTKMPGYTYGTDPLNPDQQYGTWNDETGYGSINAQAALQLLSGCNTAPFATPTTINGPEGVCRSASTQVFTVAPVAGATSYQWQLPAGASGTSTTNSISVDFNATYTTGNICVTAVNDCVQSTPFCRSVKYNSIQPTAPISITGKTIGLCSNELYAIAGVANATTYNWLAPANTTIVTGQGTTNIELLINPAFVSGNLTVTASNCAGTSSARLIRLVNGLATPSRITGPVTGVCAGSTQSYSCSNVTGATSYIWTLPTGSVINSGQGTNTISVTFQQAFVSGKLLAVAQNACKTSAARSVTIASKPGVPGTITGPVSVCPSSVGLVYSINAVAGVTYNWLVPGGAIIKSGQGTPSITLDWGTLAGTVKVSAVNACGASSFRTLMVNLLTCALPSITMGKMEEAYAAPRLEVMLAPNPVKDMLNIMLNDFVPNQPLELILMQADGKLQQTQSIIPTMKGQLVRMDVNRMAAGFYLLQVKQNGLIVTRQFIIAR